MAVRRFYKDISTHRFRWQSSGRPKSGWLNAIIMTTKPCLSRVKRFYDRFIAKHISLHLDTSRGCLSWNLRSSFQNSIKKPGLFQENDRSLEHPTISSSINPKKTTVHEQIYSGVKNWIPALWFSATNLITYDHFPGSKVQSTPGVPIGKFSQ